MKRFLTPAALVVICLLGLTELGARLFFAQDISGRFDYGYHPQAGFAEHADGTVELFRAGGRRFYPQTFRRQRPPGEFRILTIGDSVPRGPSLKGAYPWLLGEELRQHGIAAESLNLAVPGYGARRCQIVLRQALNYDPSLVILHFDDYNKWEDEREWRRSQEFQGWHPRHWLMKIFIFRRLYEAKLEKIFWPLVPEEIRLRYALNDADAQVAAGADPREVAARLKLAYDTAVENVAMVRARHIPVILVPMTPGGGRPRPPLPLGPWPGCPGRVPDGPRRLSRLHAGRLIRAGYQGHFCQLQRPLAPEWPSNPGAGHLREDPPGTGRPGTPEPQGGGGGRRSGDRDRRALPPREGPSALTAQNRRKPP